MRVRQNKKKRLALIILASIVVLGAGAFAAAYFIREASTGDRPENTPDYSAPTDDQKKAGDQAKEDFIEKHYSDEDDASDSSSDDSPASKAVELTITSANQSNSTYQFRTMIQSLDGNGVCTLELTRQGADGIMQQAGTQILGSYSVCKGFDISTSGIQKGNWQVKISYRGSAGEMGVAQREVEVR